MKIPRTPLSKEAHEHLKDKYKHMKGREKEKTIKRLETYDRGYREKKDEWEKRVEVDSSHATEAKLRRDYEKRKQREQ